MGCCTRGGSVNTAAAAANHAHDGLTPTRGGRDGERGRGGPLPATQCTNLCTIATATAAVQVEGQPVVQLTDGEGGHASASAYHF